MINPRSRSPPPSTPLDHRRSHSHCQHHHCSHRPRHRSITSTATAIATATTNASCRGGLGGGVVDGDKPLLQLSPPIHFPGRRPPRPSPPLRSRTARPNPLASPLPPSSPLGRLSWFLPPQFGGLQRILRGLRDQPIEAAPWRDRGGGGQWWCCCPPPLHPPVGGGGTVISPPPKSNPQTAAPPPPQPQPPQHMLPPLERNRPSTLPALATATATHPMEEPRAIA